MTLSLRRWLPVVLWLVFIYTTIPFVGSLREWFIARWDPALIAWGVGATVVVAALGGLEILRRRGYGLSPGGAVWVVCVAAVLLLWAYQLRRRPEEAVHLIEYGGLAVLVHRALRPSMPDSLVFVAGALVGALAGTADEVIQWLSPSRVWDWRDVAINGGAGALVQLALWRATAPLEALLSARSIRIVLRLAAAQLVLLTACLANTPVRVARYAPQLPGLEHLTSSLNPMAEYGHRHALPELGVFKSRLTLAELATEDRVRAAEVAALLDQSRRNYGRFLDTWSVADDPFTYEARVHLFSRNHNLGKARAAGLESASAREPLTVARFENQLLERFFGATLAQSSFRWGPRLRQRVEAGSDPARLPTSAVGSHLITFTSERRLRALLLTALALLGVADLATGRYHRTRS